MQRYSVAIATALIIFLGIQAGRRFYASRMSPSAEFTTPNGQNIERAVIDAQMNVRMLVARGDLDCRRAEGLSNLVKTLNAAQGLVPEEETRFRKSGRFPHNAILHVAGRPTGPWQVVLASKSTHDGIRVAGYGTDLSEPLVSKDIKCR